MKPRIPIATRVRVVTGVLCAVLLAAGGLLAQSTLASTRTAVAFNGAPSLHVSGRGLFTAHSRRMVLHGINRPGGEFFAPKAGASGTARWTRPR